MAVDVEQYGWMPWGSDDQLWKAQFIRIECDVPVETVRQRLQRVAAKTNRRRDSASWTLLGGERVVRVVALSGDRLRLSARYPHVRNSWRRMLLAELRAGPGGQCVLHGTLRWPKPVTIFTVCWCLGLLLLTLITTPVAVAGVIVAVVHGKYVWRSLEPVGFLMVFWFGATAMFGVSFRLARADERFLLRWLRQELTS